MKSPQVFFILLFYFFFLLLSCFTVSFMFYCIYNILGGLLIALRDTTELNPAHLFFFFFQFSSNEKVYVIPVWRPKIGVIRSVPNDRGCGWVTPPPIFSSTKAQPQPLLLSEINTIQTTNLPPDSSLLDHLLPFFIKSPQPKENQYGFL